MAEKNKKSLQKIKHLSHDVTPYCTRQWVQQNPWFKMMAAPLNATAMESSSTNNTTTVHQELNTDAPNTAEAAPEYDAMAGGKNCPTMVYIFFNNCVPVCAFFTIFWWYLCLPFYSFKKPMLDCVGGLKIYFTTVYLILSTSGQWRGRQEDKTSLS